MKNSAYLGILGNSAKVAFETLDGAVEGLKPARISAAVRSEAKGTLLKGRQFISDEQFKRFVQQLDSDHPVKRRIEAMREIINLVDDIPTFAQAPTTTTGFDIPTSQPVKKDAAPVGFDVSTAKQIEDPFKMQPAKKDTAPVGFGVSTAKQIEDPFKMQPVKKDAAPVGFGVSTAKPPVGETVTKGRPAHIAERSGFGAAPTDTTGTDEDIPFDLNTPAPKNNVRGFNV